MKILLIGGTGTLSTDVTKICMNEDLYLLNRGRRPLPENINLIKADINNTEYLKKELKDQRFDVVVDFLAFSKDRLKAHLSIFKDKCEQFIFISSATVYKQTNEIITEETPLFNPSWHYSIRKKECEEFLSHQSDVNYTIVRPYITYGDTRIPFVFTAKTKQWTLVDRIIREQPIIVCGGKITLTHTEDFAKGLFKLFGNKEAFGKAFHITSDECFTWKEVAEKIGKIFDKKVTVIHVDPLKIEELCPALKGEISTDRATMRRFNNDKMKQFDWECKIPFDVGLRRTIEYYQQNPNMLRIDLDWNRKVDKLIDSVKKENPKPKTKPQSTSLPGGRRYVSKR